MLLSSSFLKTTYERYMKNKEKLKKNSKINILENYNVLQSSAAGISASFDGFILILAIIFFVLELLLLFYAISLALRCTKPGPERIVHVTLSFTFTLPYILIASFFSKCAQSSMQNGDLFLVPKRNNKLSFV